MSTPWPGTGGRHRQNPHVFRRSSHRMIVTKAPAIPSDEAVPRLVPWASCGGHYARRKTDSADRHASSGYAAALRERESW